MRNHCLTLICTSTCTTTDHYTGNFVTLVKPRVQYLSRYYIMRNFFLSFFYRSREKKDKQTMLQPTQQSLEDFYRPYFLIIFFNFVFRILNFKLHKPLMYCYTSIKFLHNIYLCFQNKTPNSDSAQYINCKIYVLCRF